MSKYKLSPLTKTEFLEAFKNTRKYIKDNYIKQEVFLNNMVDAMCYAYSFQQNSLGDAVMNVNAQSFIDPSVLLVRRNMMTNSFSDNQPPIPIDKFNDKIFKQYVIQITYSFDPIKWGCFELLSEELINQMHEEADSYDTAALFDLVGIALTAAGGKIVKSVAQKLSRKGLKTTAKTITKLFDEETLSRKIGSEKGMGMDLYKNGGMNFSANGYNFLAIPGPAPLAANGVYSGIRNYFSGEIISSYDGIKEYTDMATRHLPIDNDTKNQISIGSAMALDYGTDFVPVLGNAKSLSSFLTNTSISDELRENIKSIKKHKEQEYSDKDKAIKNTICVEIKKDLHSFDKKTLYRMMKYALTQNKKQLS